MNNSYVFLHGFSGSPAVWDDVRAALPPESRVLCPRLAGHAGSPPPLSFELEIERLARLIDGAALGRVHLCGYSMGARLALGLLVNHGELFDSATLISVHPGLASTDERVARIEQDEQWAQMIEREGIDAFVDKWEMHPIFATQASASPEALQRQRTIRLTHSPEGLASAMRSLSLGRMPFFGNRLASITSRVELIVGALDSKFCKIAEEMLTMMPACSLSVVSGVGHNVLLERPEMLAAHVKA